MFILKLRGHVSSEILVEPPCDTKISWIYRDSICDTNGVLTWNHPCSFKWCCLKISCQFKSSYLCKWTLVAVSDRNSHSGKKDFTFLSNVTFFFQSENSCFHKDSPLSPNIHMQILLTVLQIFLMLLVGRIWLNINTFHVWWSFFLFSWPVYLTNQWYCKEKLDACYL